MELEEALKRATELIKAKEDKKLKQSLEPKEEKPKQKRNIRDEKKEKIRETLKEAREKSLLVRQAKKQILEGMKEEKGLERHRTERKVNPPTEEIKPIIKEQPVESKPVESKPEVPVETKPVVPVVPAQLAQPTPPVPQLPSRPKYYMPTMNNIKKLHTTMYAPF